MLTLHYITSILSYQPSCNFDHVEVNIILIIIYHVNLHTTNDITAWLMYTKSAKHDKIN